MKQWKSAIILTALFFSFASLARADDPPKPPATAGNNVKAATAPVPVTVQSGVATDGIHVPLPPGVTEDTVTGTKAALQVNGSFSEVSGLELETPAIEYRNGSEDTVMRKIPGLSKHPHVVLKRADLARMDPDDFGDSVGSKDRSDGESDGKARDLVYSGGSSMQSGMR